MGRLDALLSARARRTPRRTAIEDVARGGAWSWRDWDDAAERAARRLAEVGVRPGHRVALLLERSFPYLAWFLGCARAGAVAVPLDPLSPGPELLGYLAHAECAMAVLDSSLPQLADLAAAATAHGALDVAGDRLLRPARSSELSPPGDVLLLYTSGSTGTPRAVRLTHAGIAASLRALAAACALQPRTRTFSTLSLTASHGLFVHGLAPLAHGGTLLLAPLASAYNARAWWNEAHRLGATFFSSVPAVLSLLLSLAEGAPPPALRVYSASAPLPPDLQESFRDRFGTPLRNAFGMSEAAGWFLYGSDGAPTGAVGRPAGCEVRVSNADGELQVRGAQVTPGYWRNAAANAEALTEGWLRTGDLVRSDAAGWIHCVGRRKRIIKRAGQTVHPEDIEAVLATAAGIQEAAVVGVTHPVYGEVPRAFVVAKPGVTLDVADLHRLLRERLSSFRLPRWLEVVDFLPHLRGGKPDLLRLAERPLPGE